MFLLGLSGGMAMGKSSISRYLRMLNIPVHDSDACVHRLMQYGGSVYKKLQDIIPEAITKEAVDRQILSNRIKEDTSFLTLLEQIIHPEVRKDRNMFLRMQACRGQKLVVLDVPLLFEGGWYQKCDAIAIADCPAWLQRERILKRGVNIDKMKLLLSRQWSNKKRKIYADYIIQTGLSFASTRRSVRLMLKHIHNQKAHLYSPAYY